MHVREELAYAAAASASGSPLSLRALVPRSELAVRDGRVRELREERDAVMASVRQRDSALQVGTRHCPIYGQIPDSR